jgi:hypothetical protein
MYCSKVCQKQDWKRQHKQICKSLNVGEGAMQVRASLHLVNAAGREDAFKESECRLNDNKKRFFKLFKESTLEGSQAAARKMKKIAARETKRNQKELLFFSLYLLIHTDSEKLLWPNSPLLVLLQFVDPNALTNSDVRVTLLSELSVLAGPSDFSTHENQVTLGRQLIEHGANVNDVSYPGETPLHRACGTGNTTNLDFIELLLENGADPNAQDALGLTPLMRTAIYASGAANFMLEWASVDVNTDVNIFLALVRLTIEHFSDQIEISDNPDRAEDQFVRGAVENFPGHAALPDNLGRAEQRFLRKQWREIEEMLMERGATETEFE